MLNIYRGLRWNQTLEKLASVEYYVHIKKFARRIAFTGSLWSTRTPFTAKFLVRIKWKRSTAVAASFCAWRKAADVNFWFGFKRSMTLEIWRKWKVSENDEKSTAKRKAHAVLFSGFRTNELVAAVKETVWRDEGWSYVKIAAEMGYNKSTICRKIKQNISFCSYGQSYCMFVTEAPKESRKVKSGALLNKFQHRSARTLRLFSGKKKLDQEQKSNKQNHTRICKDIEEVPVLGHTKFPSSVMFLVRLPAGIPPGPKG